MLGTWSSSLLLLHYLFGLLQLFFLLVSHNHFLEFTHSNLILQLPHAFLNRMIDILWLWNFIIVSHTSSLFRYFFEYFASFPKHYRFRIYVELSVISNFSVFAPKFNSFKLYLICISIGFWRSGVCSCTLRLLLFAPILLLPFQKLGKFVMGDWILRHRRNFKSPLKNIWKNKILKVNRNVIKLNFGTILY